MKLSLRFGLILGGISIFWMLFELVLANQLKLFSASTITSMLAIFIPIIVLTIAIKKDKATKSFYETQDAVKTGFVISFVGATITATYVFIIYSIFPQIIEPFLQFYTEQMVANELPQEEITQAIEQIRIQFTPVSQAMYTFIFSLSSGVAISYILGKVLRTKIKHSEISATPPTSS